MSPSVLLLLPILLFSIIVHEVAHGVVAERWGDPTARMLGRITLNPLAHIDPLGTVLVPALLIVSGSGILFGWAKPVPITPDNFRDRKMGDIAVSLAGPASNVVLACAFGVALAVAGSVLGPAGISSRVWTLGIQAVYLNFILATFNLLPIPPLDGSHVVANLLPPSTAYAYRSMSRYGLFIVFAMLWLPGLRQLIFLPARIATGVVLGLIQALV